MSTKYLRRIGGLILAALLLTGVALTSSTTAEAQDALALIASELRGARTVTDLTGKVVKQFNASDKNTTLNISNAAKGIYILKIVGEGKTATRKIEVE